MLAYGKIIFQRNDMLQKIQNIAVNNLKLKTKYSNEEILMHKYSIDDFWDEVWRDVENENYLAFGIDSYLLINNIIELFLKLSGESLRQPNEIYMVLNDVDKNFSVKNKNFVRKIFSWPKKMTSYLTNWSSLLLQGDKMMGVFPCDRPFHLSFVE